MMYQIICRHVNYALGKTRMQVQNLHIHISSDEGYTNMTFAFCVVLIQSIVIFFLKKGGVHIKNYHQIICHTQ
jgi:hypothetical protein